MGDPTEIQCPVCGYYCLGKGGFGCIDKPTLCGLTEGNNVTNDLTKKAQHVRNAQQNRNHTCHWPGCDKQVPPATWGCKLHWFKLPQGLRNRVWATYRAGQENDLRPSEAYLKVADDVQKWIRENG